MDGGRIERMVFWWLSAIFAGLSLFCFLTAAWSDEPIRRVTSGVIGLMPTITMAYLSKRDW
jgi:uncharacterized membrane protein YhaH (DUF805 family)